MLGNLAGVAPSSAIFIAVYEPVKAAVLASLPKEKDYMGPIIAGMAAGAAASLTRVPTEVVKQRLQTGEFKSAITAIRSIVAKEGMRGLYAGCVRSAEYRCVCRERLQVGVVFHHAAAPSRRFGRLLPRSACAGCAPGALAEYFSAHSYGALLLRLSIRALRQSNAQRAAPAMLTKHVPVSACSYGAFLLRDLPFDAIEFVAYEQVGDLRLHLLVDAAWLSYGGELVAAVLYSHHCVTLVQGSYCSA